MAAIADAGPVCAEHQSLLNRVGQSPWPDEQVLQEVRELVLPRHGARGSDRGWIVDGKGFAK